MAKISVITPLYNRESIFPKTIESVLNQKFSDWEYIIVDDGSTDKSWHIASSYARLDSRIKVIKRNRPPQSGSTCRNIGVQNVTSNLLIFLDSDDILEPHCLEQRYEYMCTHPEIDMCIFPIIIEIDENPNNRTINPKQTNRSYLERLLSYDIPWQTMAPVWRKDFIHSLNGFNEEFPRLQDVEIFIRALTSDKNVQVAMDYPPDCIFHLNRKKTIPFDTMFRSIRLLLRHISPLINQQDKKLMRHFLFLFLLSSYYPEATYENYKKTNKLISSFREQQIISFWNLPSLSIILFIHLCNYYWKNQLGRLYSFWIQRTLNIKTLKSKTD